MRNAWHPVAWLGRVLGPVGRGLKTRPPCVAFAGGALVWLAMAVVLGMVACSFFAAVAGVLLSSSLATGDPTVGPGYLLPAFAAAFLGSTQFRNGRFNVLGTVVAVYVLATGS